MAVLAALFGLGYWLSRGQGDTIDVKVVFNGKVSGLGRGSNVLFNGLRVGEVKELGIEPDNPRQIYAVLKVSQSAPLRVDTIARLEAQGLAGIVAVQLRGGKRAAAPLTAAPGQPLPTIIAESSESIFEKVESIAKGVDEALVGIDAAIQANAVPVSERIKSVENLSAELAGNSSKVDTFMIVGATRIAAYAAWTASVRSPFAAALLYILPIAAIILATSFIFYGARIQPVLARITAPLVMPLVNLAARFRRA